MSSIYRTSVERSPFGWEHIYFFPFAVIKLFWIPRNITVNSGITSVQLIAPCITALIFHLFYQRHKFIILIHSFLIDVSRKILKPFLANPCLDRSSSPAGIYNSYRYTGFLLHYTWEKITYSWISHDIFLVHCFPWHSFYIILFFWKVIRIRNFYISDTVVFIAINLWSKFVHYPVYR